MIGWLRGELLQRGSDGELLVDVGRSRLSGARAFDLCSRRSATSEGPSACIVHTHVREDAIVLYGFATLNERRCFEALLAAHGVGPSLALAVLSSLHPDSLVRAVIDCGPGRSVLSSGDRAERPQLGSFST